MKKITNYTGVFCGTHNLKLKMRITTLLLFAFILNSQASTYSQATKVNITLNNGTVEDFFKKVEKSTSYKFLYHVGEINLDYKVNVSAKDKPLNQILDEVFKGKNISYKLLNKQIVLYKETKKAIGIKISQSQKTYSGTVKNAKGAPLSDVAVWIKGSSLGTYTDAKGFFSLEAKEQEVLVFSLVGMKEKEVVLGSNYNLNVLMEEFVSELDEVVLVAYGSTSKRFNTGSVGSITSSTIEKQPVNNPILALQGNVAGVYITQGTGRPGSNIQVNVRGVNSINGSPPLYIVDGVPFSAFGMNQFVYDGNPNLTQSPLNLINPDDIESISVLKDADATSIYGSRGANGVILITTKKRATKGFSVSANVSSGVKDVAHKMDVLNTKQYLDLRKEAFANDGITPTPENAPDLFIYDQNLDMNWQDYLMGRTATYNHYQLSMNTGDSNSSFSLNGSYRDETTVNPGNFGYKNYSLNSRYDFTSKDNNFHIGTQVTYSGDNSKSFMLLVSPNLLLAPNYNLFKEDGSLDWTTTNPLASFNRTFDAKSTSLRANVNMDYKFFEYFKAILAVGYTKADMDQYSKNPSTSLDPAYAEYSWGKPNVEKGKTVNTTLNIEPQITYTKNIGPNSIEALAGATLMNNKQDNLYIHGTQYSSDLFLDNIGAAGDLAITSTISNYKYASLFGRLKYAYNNKYIINGTIRNDGSSRFGPNNRFGTFGSVGAAWIFTEEKFLKENKILSFGKLRSSYGTSGNDNVGDYQYYELWASTSGVNSPAGSILRPEVIPNKNFSWEKITKFDVALELGFLKDNILLNMNYYRNETSDQLVGKPLPSTTGFNFITTNLPALIRNTGFEISLDTKNIATKNFKWFTNINFTLPKNELVRFENLESSSYANRYEIGQNITVQKGFDASVDPNTGLLVIKDQNGDDQITYQDDQINLGNTMPKFYGGVTNSFNLYNFQLSFMFQFVKQEGWGYRNLVFRQPGDMQNFDVSVLDRWQQPGDVTNVPKLTSILQSDFFNSIYSSLNWEDSSFIKLRNVSFSYDFPKESISKAGLKNLRLYFQGQNLLTITSYKGLDPETGTLIDPPLRVYSLGLQLDF
ncbi:SusC/RagA family TonB-linked outer membrane protein [Flavobacterium pectinovorum]|uniref:SusC/RagA family TonB-linked outer membrane protein n=1 Tax=Flavobacterium pectinovorum TaxID=29533 RepID=UPI001FAD669B|nr:SusC/RagA family TonB-linked outer membrane protein [Flavobacterium pectinovorum]MCI9844600.1 SusC/RagA family TonB-linked outer membrane protein [Flavobacterium pectinovorum]